MRRVPPLLAFVLLVFGARPTLAQDGASRLDTGDWQHVLSTYVTADGGVRYAALRANAADRARLDAFVAAVAAAEPAGWSRDAQLAFYLDAYNALTVKAVVDRWPIASVMRVDGFFDRVRHRVAGRALTLNQLENDVIRSRRFAEPRIHFALNCASASCPPLRRRAYASGDLDRALEAQTRAFVRATTRRRGDAVEVSRIFEWYGEDFGGPAGVRRFVAARTDGPLAAALRDEEVALRYADYDWDVNAR